MNRSLLLSLLALSLLFVLPACDAGDDDDTSDDDDAANCWTHALALDGNAAGFTLTTDEGYGFVGARPDWAALSAGAWVAKLDGSASLLWEDVTGVQSAHRGVSAGPDGGLTAVGDRVEDDASAGGFRLLAFPSDGQAPLETVETEGVDGETFNSVMTQADGTSVAVGARGRLMVANPDGTKALSQAYEFGLARGVVAHGAGGWVSVGTEEWTDDDGIYHQGMSAGHVAASGEVVWSRRYLGADGVTDSSGRAIVTIEGGDFLLIGREGAITSGSHPVFLQAIDAAGEPMWSTLTAADFEGLNIALFPVAAVTLPGGHLIVVGEAGRLGDGDSDAWVARFDAQGAQVWSHIFSGPDETAWAVGVGVNGAGNIVVGGVREDGGPKQWILELTPEGAAICN